MDLSNFTNEQLQKAREYAALVHIEIAENVHTADYYEDHVTYEQKEKIKEDALEIASMILQGELDVLVKECTFTSQGKVYHSCHKTIKRV